MRESQRNRADPCRSAMQVGKAAWLVSAVIICGFSSPSEVNVANGNQEISVACPNDMLHAASSSPEDKLVSLPSGIISVAFLYYLVSGHNVAGKLSARMCKGNWLRSSLAGIRAFSGSLWLTARCRRAPVGVRNDACEILFLGGAELLQPVWMLPKSAAPSRPGGSRRTRKTLIVLYYFSTDF